LQHHAAVTRKIHLSLLFSFPEPPLDKNLCEPERQSGALVELSGVEIPFGGYYLVVNKRAGRRKAVRAICQWLLEECPEASRLSEDGSTHDG
jgi:DNA-binding transcriptional LysR family regulator